MSSFVKLLESVRRGGQGFGFTARATAAPPALAVLAVVPGVDPEMVQAVSQAGADAIGLAVARADVPDGAMLKSVRDVAGGKPVGLMLSAPDQGQEAGSEGWETIGLDFLLLDSDQPAALLAVDVAKLVVLRLDFDPMQARALDGLPVDGFVVESQAQGRNGLSIAEIARYRLLASATGRPVLAGLRQEAAPGDLKALSQAGVDGVVLLPPALGDEPAVARDAVARVKGAVARLGPRRVGKDRTTSSTPLLPRYISSASEGEGEEDQ